MFNECVSQGDTVPPSVMVLPHNAGSQASLPLGNWGLAEPTQGGYTDDISQMTETFPDSVSVFIY